MKLYDTVIIGGGAAGFFASIQAARSKKTTLLLEQTQHLLSKVKISGGGRCNVTHACFEPSQLIQNYPRGSKELLGPFHCFQPRDTLDWFREEGVKIISEADGRMFPSTNNSQTIIDTLIEAAERAEVEVKIGNKVIELKKKEAIFEIFLKSGETIYASSVMLATGSNREGYKLAQKFGHSIIDPVPSLFTFNIPNSPLHALAGVSVPNANIKLPQFKMEYAGPLLITHWGFSGPAILKLSAFGARHLQKVGYQTHCEIDWIPAISEEELRDKISKQTSKKLVMSNPSLSELPKQLWKSLCNLDEQLSWRMLSKKQREKLIQRLKRDRYEIKGKTGYKKEFVTCGGVKCSEINFKTMESRITPGLFFGGEILNIDGITGGFNFQAAWTTGWIAGNHLGSSG